MKGRAYRGETGIRQNSFGYGLQSGIYLYQLQAGSYREVKKLVVLP